MHKSQANRAVIAARATASTRLQGNRSVGTNPAARVQTRVTPSGHVKRTRAAKMTGAQRNSVGKRSEWNDSMDYFTDPKWDQTVSRQR